MYHIHNISNMNILYLIYLQEILSEILLTDLSLPTSSKDNLYKCISIETDFRTAILCIIRELQVIHSSPYSPIPSSSLRLLCHYTSTLDPSLHPSVLCTSLTKPSLSVSEYHSIFYIPYFQYLIYLLTVFFLFWIYTLNSCNTVHSFHMKYIRYFPFKVYGILVYIFLLDDWSKIWLDGMSRLLDCGIYYVVVSSVLYMSAGVGVLRSDISNSDSDIPFMSKFFTAVHCFISITNTHRHFMFLLDFLLFLLVMDCVKKNWEGMKELNGLMNIRAFWGYRKILNQQILRYRIYFYITLLYLLQNFITNMNLTPQNLLIRNCFEVCYMIGSGYFIYPRKDKSYEQFMKWVNLRNCKIMYVANKEIKTVPHSLAPVCVRFPGKYMKIGYLIEDSQSK